MKSGPVHWSEGMLLLPHHFQAAEQHWQDALATAFDWAVGYGYGLREIEISPEALQNFEVRIPRLAARLRDGTILVAPDTTTLETLDVRGELHSGQPIYVQVVVPEIAPGRPNASRRNAERDRRNIVVEEEWLDRNEAANPRTIERVRANAVLVATPTAEPPRGFAGLTIARLRRSARADAAPEIDPEYIPPLLACDAWTPLVRDYLLVVRSLMGGFLKKYADVVRKLGGWSEANKPDIRRRIQKLAAVNQSYPYLSQLAGMRGIHPAHAYLELCRIVGQLAMFRDDWQAPDLPAYDHDDLGRIFRTVFQHIDMLLRDEELPCERFDFRGVERWMEVELQPAWLENPPREFFVGVRSDLNVKKLHALFHPQWLNWKLGSATEVEVIFRQGQKGLDLQLVEGPHPSLPPEADVAYYRVLQDGPFWDQVARSRRLGLYINEVLVRGDFVGKNTIPVLDPAQHVRELTFYLYVVKR